MDATDATEGLGYEPLPFDDVLRMNHVRVKGTHNSYHLEPEIVFDDSHRYSHPTLTDQLWDHDVRMVELDLHWNVDEGMQVFHIPSVDPRSTCLAFADCLAEIAEWSDANPGHLPVHVWLEPKREFVGVLSELEPMDDHWDELDQALIDGLGRDRLLTPDDLRGEAASIAERLSSEGWPTLAESRGRVMVGMIAAGDDETGYAASAPTLAGKVIFVNATSRDSPTAATWKDAGGETATELAQLGLLVTANVTSAGRTDEENAAAEEAELNSGVHFMATDIPAPVDGRDYWMDLPPSCNPVTAPPECSGDVLER